VRKPGFVEKNLSRDGNLVMADEPPAEEVKGYAGVVPPGQPYTLNFVLVGSPAKMSATLVEMASRWPVTACRSRAIPARRDRRRRVCWRRARRTTTAGSRSQTFRVAIATRF
jgi:hypothetical protein